MAVDPDRDALEDALQQIVVIDQRLRAGGDLTTLNRFGDADAGIAIAASLGHALLTTAEARVVDQLSRMPGGTRLVRTYLGHAGAPRLCELQHLPAADESAPAGPRP